MVHHSRNSLGGLFTLLVIGGLIYFLFIRVRTEGFADSKAPLTKPKPMPKKRSITTVQASKPKVPTPSKKPAPLGMM